MATRKRNSSKRGGYWGLGSVINTAIVPGSLLALQQGYRRKKNGGRRTKRRGGRRGGTRKY
jgi:hypothetical protein